MSAPAGPRAARLLVPSMAILVLVVGVLLMREATQSRHRTMHPASRVRVVVAPHSNRPEQAQKGDDVVRAHLSYCQLEVGSAIEGDVEQVSDDPVRFAVVLAPALDETDRKQFRGCVEDWMVDNHRIDVIEMEEYRLP